MKQNRISELRQYFMQHKRATCDELCAEFGVSLATIRRDLDELERSGSVRRFYGGAELTEHIDESIPQELLPDWNSREYANISEKQAIAKELAAMIPDNCTIYLDSGTSVYEVARLLSVRTQLTVITNSLRNAALLGMNKQIQVYLIGGNVQFDMLASTGILAMEGLNFFPSIDICVLSCDGFARSWGIRDWSMENALLKKAVADRSKQVFVAIDHTKFNVPASSPILPMSRIDLIATDSGVSPDVQEMLKKNGVKVLLADIK